MIRTPDRVQQNLRLDLIGRNRQAHSWSLPEEAAMEWHTPKLVEIACGCEINAYFPADL